MPSVCRSKKGKSMSLSISTSFLIYYCLKFFPQSLPQSPDFRAPDLCGFLDYPFTHAFLNTAFNMRNTPFLR